MGGRPLKTLFQWLPTSFADLVAGIMVLAGLIILAMGIDGEVKSLVAIGAAWLFGSTWRNSKRREGE